jgi:DNA (cytosine-5)-methyltransferase 1
MKHLSLFSGIGGFDLAAEWLGWENVAHVEISEYCRNVLKIKFPKAESYEDIKETDFTRFRGSIGVMSGGFPCQDISAANFNAVGIEGERSGLWSEYSRAIYEARPDYVVIENSPQLLRKGFEKVLYDLSEIGYDAEWECFSAKAFGLPHERERLYVVAYPNGFRQQGPRNILKNTRYHPASREWETNRVINAIQRKTLPPLCDSNHGFSTQLALSALGNAVCPIIPFSIFKAIEKYESQ